MSDLDEFNKSNGGYNESTIVQIFVATIFILTFLIIVVFIYFPVFYHKYINTKIRIKRGILNI